jgi:hypothetical protein
MPPEYRQGRYFSGSPAACKLPYVARMTESIPVAPQTLAGFEWQLRRALLALFGLRVGQVLEIEVIDDVSVRLEDGTLLTALQTKHALGEGSLTARSPEWWKTLRVWTQLLTAGKVGPDTALVLCTPLGAGEGIAPLTGQPSGDDVIAICSALDEIAAEAPNEKLSAAYSAWNGLSPGQKLALLHRVRIEAAEPRLAELRPKIDEELARVSFRDHQIPAARQRILGWLNETVDVRLGLGGCKIAFEDFRTALTDIRETALPSNLVPLMADAPVPPLEEEDMADPIYLRQLRLLEASAEDRQFAVAMLHRAVAERDNWLNQSLVGTSALSAFRGELKNVWTRERLRATRTAPKTEPEAVKVGWEVHDACGAHSAQISGSPAPPHMTVGTFYLLSNAPPDEPEIGWHPEYVVRLKK